MFASDETLHSCPVFDFVGAHAGGMNSSLMNGVGIKYYTRQLMDIALWGKACPLWVT
jgi:hypothetical protein